jgi:nicotinate-nucleotide--dimethylbenzimidazole phosphoribosyltransferase
VIDDALSRGPFTSPVATLAALGGFELAAMTGAYLEAAAQRKVVLVDGFIATAALLVATRIEPKVIDMCIFSHCSDEQGHRALLRELGGTPLLELGMRLGEGSGALVAYPLLVQSCELLARMATFSSARVDTRR